MIDKIDKILPKYSIIPVLSMLLLNAVTYFGTRVFTSGMVHHNIGSAIDQAIPFLPVFIIIYIMAYIQWISGFIMICRESRSSCRWVISAEIIAKTICLIIFVVFPTTIVRPVIVQSDIFSRITACVYSMDPADNLLPSIHCLESWFCFRGAMYMKKTHAWYLPVMAVATILVFASTIFTKQHVLWDVLAAVIVAELGLWISAKLFPTEAMTVKNNRRYQLS